jgi:hypothetical protein
LSKRLSRLRFRWFRPVIKSLAAAPEGSEFWLGEWKKYFSWSKGWCRFDQVIKNEDLACTKAKNLKGANKMLFIISRVCRSLGRSTLLPALFLFPVLSLADGASFYAGLGYGAADFEGPRIGGALPALAPGQRLKDDAGLAELYFGYRFNRFISFEIGYSDFGEVSKTYALNPDVASLVSPNDTEVIDSSGVSFGALMEYPLSGRFDVFAVLGYSKFDLDRQWSGGFSPSSDPTHYSGTGSEESWIFGLGLKYDFNREYAARLQWLQAEPGNLRIEILRLSLEKAF